MSRNLFPMHYSEEEQIADGPAPGSVDSRAVDESLRLPVMVLFGNAVHWFVVAAVISLVLSIKLIIPGFLGGISFLSYGRLAPVARDLFLYGWASQAALGAGLWLAARLAGRPLATTSLGSVILSTLMTSATVLWNLAVLLGSLAILCGYSTGVEWLEYPGWAAGALFASFLMIGIWALMIFDRRVGEGVEVAQWYLVAGFCSFPWIYGTANLLLVWKPIAAPAQGAVQAWFFGTFTLLWLLPIALAALYALMPRVLQEHLHRRHLASLGFWSLLFLGGWSGIQSLIGGPIPAWMTAVGVVSGVLFVVPVIIAAINLMGISNNGPTPTEEESAGIPERFLRLGLAAFIAFGAVSAVISLPLISGALNFTGVSEAKTHLLLWAISLPLFAILYEAAPHLLGRAAWCPKCSELHYWLSLVGFWLLAGSLALGGFFTGLALSDPTVSFLNITSYMSPFHLLDCVAQLILLAASLMIGLNLTRALVGDYLFPKR